MDDQWFEIVNGVAEKHGFSVENVKNMSREPHKVRIGKILDQIRSNDDRKSMISYEIGSYSLDISQNILENDGDLVRLTEKETALLVVLATKKGQLVSRRQLLDEVWGYAESAETHTLETHIYRLRQKIERDPGHPDIILTDDDGYRLEVLD